MIKYQRSDIKNMYLEFRYGIDGKCELEDSKKDSKRRKVLSRILEGVVRWRATATVTPAKHCVSTHNFRNHVLHLGHWPSGPMFQMVSFLTPLVIFFPISFLKIANLEKIVRTVKKGGLFSPEPFRIGCQYDALPW